MAPRSDRLSASFTVAVFIEREGKLLMVRKKKTGLWGVPAGHLLRGETVLEAAAREAMEEGNLEVIPYAILGIFHFPKKTGLSICVAIRAFISPNATFVPQDGEIDEVDWKDRSWVEWLISSKELYRPEFTAHNLMAWLNGERYTLKLLSEFRVPWAT